MRSQRVLEECLQWIDCLTDTETTQPALASRKALILAGLGKWRWVRELFPSPWINGTPKRQVSRRD